MENFKLKEKGCGRREFLSMITAAAAIGLIDPGSIAENSEQRLPDLPTIALGPHRISRLVCGSNPILGYSYMGPHTDQHMKQYFTTDKTLEFLRKCEQAGITTHQFAGNLDYVRLLNDQGTRMKLICLHSSREKIGEAIGIGKPIALAHHGGETDQLFAQGKSKVVHDYVKAVKDRGLLAGVSSHSPNVIKQIADEGWENDFFMTCFYFLSRYRFNDNPDVPTVEVSNLFLKDDPKNMTSVIKQVNKPCLAFKILGAGRLCKNQEMVRAAFQFAFENIKPSDGVIVGMFPWYFDEIGANTKYVQDLGKLSNS